MCRIANNTNIIVIKRLLRAYDFEAAHQFLDETDNLPYPPDQISVGEWEEKEKAFDYIFNAEAMYLLKEVIEKV